MVIFRKIATPVKPKHTEVTWSRERLYQACKTAGAEALDQALYDEYVDMIAKQQAGQKSYGKVQFDYMGWDQNARFRSAPHSEETCKRYLFTELWAVKKKVPIHTAPQKLKEAAYWMRSYHQSQTRNRWGSFKVTEEDRLRTGAFGIGWREAKEDELSSIEWKNAYNEGKKIYFWDLAIAPLANNAEALTLFAAWKGGSECMLYIMGAECDCKSICATNRKHTWTGNIPQVQWGAD